MCEWLAQVGTPPLAIPYLFLELFLPLAPAPHPDPYAAPLAMSPLPLDEELFDGYPSLTDSEDEYESFPLTPNHSEDSSRVHVVIDIPESPEVVVVDFEQEEELGDRD